MRARETRLVVDWIAHAETLSAAEEVTLLLETDPDEAWRLMRMMLDVAPTEKIVSAIASGPLRQLLARYPERFADRMSEAARCDAQFRGALMGVWIAEPEWFSERIERLLREPVPLARRKGEGLSACDAALITRWFHHIDTSWAAEDLDDTIRRGAEDAWRVLLHLVREAEEGHREVLPLVRQRVFVPVIAAHSKHIAPDHEVIQRWIQSA